MSETSPQLKDKCLPDDGRRLYRHPFPFLVNQQVPSRQTVLVVSRLDDRNFTAVWSLLQLSAVDVKVDRAELQRTG